MFVLYFSYYAHDILSTEGSDGDDDDESLDGSVESLVTTDVAAPSSSGISLKHCIPLSVMKKSMKSAVSIYFPLFVHRRKGMKTLQF